MAKLTNKQLEVLSESIVDKLEEGYEQRRKDFKETEEYKNAIKQVKEGDLYKEIEAFEKDKEALLVRERVIREKLAAIVERPYIYGNPESWKEILEKQVASFNETFNREKLLTKIQADILLDDQYDAIDTYKKLTKKYEQTDRELFSK